MGFFFQLIAHTNVNKTCATLKKEMKLEQKQLNSRLSSFVICCVSLLKLMMANQFLLTYIPCQIQVENNVGY